MFYVRKVFSLIFIVTEASYHSIERNGSKCESGLSLYKIGKKMLRVK